MGHGKSRIYVCVGVRVGGCTSSWLKACNITWHRSHVFVLGCRLSAAGLCNRIFWRGSAALSIFAISILHDSVTFICNGYVIDNLLHTYTRVREWLTLQESGILVKQVDISVYLSIEFVIDQIDITSSLNVDNPDGNQSLLWSLRSNHKQIKSVLVHWMCVLFDSERHGPCPWERAGTVVTKTVNSYSSLSIWRDQYSPLKLWYSRAVTLKIKATQNLNKR